MIRFQWHFWLRWAESEKNNNSIIFSYDIDDRRPTNSIRLLSECRGGEERVRGSDEFSWRYIKQFRHRIMWRRRCEDVGSRESSAEIHTWQRKINIFIEFPGKKCFLPASSGLENKEWWEEKFYCFPISFRDVVEWRIREGLRTRPGFWRFAFPALDRRHFVGYSRWVSHRVQSCRIFFLVHFLLRTQEQQVSEQEKEIFIECSFLLLSRWTANNNF